MSHQILQHKPHIDGLPQLLRPNTDTLEIVLKDGVSNVSVVLRYSVIEDEDVITRSAEIINGGSAPVKLTRALSGTLDFRTSQYELITFDGVYSRERWMSRTGIRYGRTEIASWRGSSSHCHNPFIIMADPSTTEERGDAFGLMLLYSGGFVFDVERDVTEQIRVAIGIAPYKFRWTLEPGVSFQTPEFLLFFANDGLGGLSRRIHRTLLDHVVRSPLRHQRRPIIVNSWEAMYFSITEQKLTDLANMSSRLGIERLVIDDGWFGRRTGDNCCLGDWTVNPDIFPSGLPAFVKNVQDRFNMSVGLWFEPEMISENSDLYRANPGFAMQIPGRKPFIGRQQWVLDMTRGDAREHLFRQMSTILNETGIRYIKWDMNRNIVDVFSQLFQAEQQGEVLHRWILGTYELLERLLSTFPDLLIEGCSGGGGRFDAGMLYYAPQSWLSDTTDGIDRLRIQFGSSFGYPPSSMGAHVARSSHHDRDLSVWTRALIAAAGTFGYEMDLTKSPIEDLAEIAITNHYYNQMRDFLATADFYRLISPFDDVTYSAWEFVSRDSSRCLLTVVQTLRVITRPVRVVRLRGLDPEAFYRVEASDPPTVMKGDVLMKVGFVLPDAGVAGFLGGDGHAWLFEFVSI